MGKRPPHKIFRPIGLRNNQLFPYVISQPNNSTNPYRAKFRIHKGLPGYSGRDLCLGNYEEEVVAALAVELFVAVYCLEYPELLPALCPLFTSCNADNVRKIVQEYPVAATDSELGSVLDI